MPIEGKQIYLGNSPITLIQNNGFVQVDPQFITPVEPGPVTDGLQIYVDATNASSYPGTGTTWTDLSGNSNDMYVSATYSSSPGYFEFRNSSGNEANINFSIPSSFTIEVWFRWQSSAAGSTFPRLTSYGSTNSYEIAVQEDGDMAWFRSTPSAWNEDASNPTFTSNTWTQILTTVSGTTHSIYKDGSFVTSATTNLPSGGTEFVVGQRWTTPLEGALTDVAIVRFYNTALSSDDVTQNWDYDKSKFGLS